MNDTDILRSYVHQQDEKRLKLQTDEQQTLEALCREMLRISDKLSWIGPMVDNLWEKKK